MTAPPVLSTELPQQATLFIIEVTDSVKMNDSNGS